MSKIGASGRLPVIEAQVAPPSSVCHRLCGVNPVTATITRFGFWRSTRMRLTMRAGMLPMPTRAQVGLGERPSSDRYTSPLLWPTQITLPLPSCTAIALMKLPLAGEGGLIERHAGDGARTLPETQSDAPPARMRLASFGSRTNGAMKLDCCVAASPQ